MAGFLSFRGFFAEFRFEPNIPREYVRLLGVLETSSSREKKMIAIGKIVNSAEVETRRLHAADRVRRLVEQFHSERKVVSDLALQHPTHEPVVLIAGAGVDPIAAAAKGRPVAEVLLNP